MAATTKKAVKTVNFRAELNKKLNGLYLKALKTKTGTKKIRKYKNQKGGFTYNKNAKRKRFTSVFKTSSLSSPKTISNTKTNSSVNLGRGKTKRNRH